MQIDQRDRLAVVLEGMGYQVKRVGGRNRLEEKRPMSELYDRMANLYHLIFPDWDASIERQVGGSVPATATGLVKRPTPAPIPPRASPTTSTTVSTLLI
jgi:hypothetical protein